MKSPFSFLNTPDEWHSFVIGVFEGFTLFIPPRFKRITAHIMVDSEYWYYSFGRGVGFLSAILTAIGIAKLIQVIF